MNGDFIDLGGIAESLDSPTEHTEVAGDGRGVRKWARGELEKPIAWHLAEIGRKVGKIFFLTNLTEYHDLPPSS